ncbi:hypothetical protein [Peribacillus asahii]|nr:hypothetical protein [Peribacillus asahii]
MITLKKLLSILLPFFLFACSSNTSGVDNSLYKDSEEIINIINQMHGQGERMLNEKEEAKLQSFFDEYKYNEDGVNKTKDEQIVYDIYHLEVINSHYMLAYQTGNRETMDEKRKEYEGILNKIESDYGIKIDE